MATKDKLVPCKVAYKDHHGNAIRQVFGWIKGSVLMSFSNSQSRFISLVLSKKIKPHGSKQGASPLQELEVITIFKGDIMDVDVYEPKERFVVDSRDFGLNRPLLKKNAPA